MSSAQPAIESLTVVGGGFMGLGVAESAVVAGIPVVVREVDPRQRDHGREKIAASLGRAVARLLQAFELEFWDALAAVG